MRMLLLGFMGSAVLFGLACGGRVVVDASSSGAGGNGGAPGNDGAGGALTSTGQVSPAGGTTTIAAVAVGPGSQVAVASVATGGSTLCAQFCSAEMGNGCDMTPDCNAQCENAIGSAGMCAPALEALLICLLQSGGTSCNPNQTCPGAVQDYAACITSTDCGNTSTCSVDGSGACDCQTSCKGVELEEKCTPGNATNFCTCFEDGKAIGKCTEPQNGPPSCDLVKGCCAQQFFP